MPGKLYKSLCAVKDWILRYIRTYIFNGYHGACLCLFQSRVAVDSVRQRLEHGPLLHQRQRLGDTGQRLVVHGRVFRVREYGTSYSGEYVSTALAIAGEYVSTALAIAGST